MCDKTQPKGSKPNSLEINPRWLWTIILNPEGFKLSGHVIHFLVFIPAKMSPVVWPKDEKQHQLSDWTIQNKVNST